MSHKKYWLRLFGMSRTPGPFEDRLADISNYMEQMYKRRVIESKVVGEDGALLVYFNTEQDRDDMVKWLSDHMPDDFLVRFPLRIGSEEWEIPHDREALMIQSLRGVRS